jgi:hypothetical protein
MPGSESPRRLSVQLWLPPDPDGGRRRDGQRATPDIRSRCRASASPLISHDLFRVPATKFRHITSSTAWRVSVGTPVRG